MNSENTDGIISEIKNASADYIVIGERALKNIASVFKASDEFQSVYEDKKNGGYGITIYRLK